ncbi:PREDICTED: retinol-binding protein 1 isoform X1 [Chinchilla lanigera]|uniref:retinol-binding protein 1 isoform X1 n=1 Tax=Chinchilla lanigera TaxID=34839 RepID=UPI000697F3DE|nr:PREDICTED: retinol-binding protein 1 isoform X1 [Chinchilla lanigera]
MPVDFTGYWKMLSNENFEEYLRALDVNVALRKIANLLKPDKEIEQDGDHMIIRTLSTFRNYIMDFQLGKEFEEDLTGIDDRKCMQALTSAWTHKASWLPGSAIGTSLRGDGMSLLHARQLGAGGFSLQVAHSPLPSAGFLGFLTILQ